jgi:hypothetical protein
MRILICALAASMLAACNPSADTDNPAVATEEATAERAADAPSPGANSFTEDQARERIVAAGYTNPSGLMQTEDGMWRGQATQGGQTIEVTVDYQGNVATAASPAPTGSTTTQP